MNKEREIEPQDGIFTNPEEVLDGLRKSAEAVGLDPDKVAPEEMPDEGPQFYAKKSCKMCWGRGIVYYVPSPVKAKKIVIDGKKKTLPANKLIDVWNPSRPEPYGLKMHVSDGGLGQYSYCSCVKFFDKEED